MAGKTSLGLRYPTFFDTIDATSFQNLATDIDGALANLDIKRQKALNRPTARVTRSSQAVTVNTSTVITFIFEQWDNAYIADVVTHDDYLLLTTGLWVFFGEVQVLGATTMTSTQVMVTVNGIDFTSQKVDGTPADVIYAHCIGMLVSTVDGDKLRLKCKWTGTGGPADVAGSLTALRVRGL